MQKKFDLLDALEFYNYLDLRLSETPDRLNAFRNFIYSIY